MAISNSTRESAFSAVMDVLAKAFPNGMMISENKRVSLAVPTGVINEKNGEELYAAVSVTVKTNEATEKTPAFDLDAAHAAYQELMEHRSEKSSKPKKSSEGMDAKRAENLARRRELAAVVSKYVREEMPDDVEMSASDFINACPELVEQGISPIQMGKIMEEVCGEQILSFERKNGKKWYSKA